MQGLVTYYSTHGWATKLSRHPSWQETLLAVKAEQDLEDVPFCYWNWEPITDETFALLENAGVAVLGE